MECWSTRVASTGEASGRFPELTEPYAPYHDIVFTEEFGPAAFIARARAEGLRDFGACMSPETAFRLLQGTESLAARMDRHLANTAPDYRVSARRAPSWACSLPGL